MKAPFARVLLEANPRSSQYPAIYCRSDRPVFFNEQEQLWELYGTGSFDFTTYFNGLSIKKLLRYTIAQGVSLHLELKGAACRVIQTEADTFDAAPRLCHEVQCVLPASDDWQSVDLELSLKDSQTFIGFIIETEGSVFIGEGGYSVEVDEGSLREVELALATTTFKKESFIIPNIKLVNEQIIESSDVIAEHFHMYVIDNGRTLDAASLSSERIKVIPNPNVGGAGGFARGMIEAMEQKPQATHVLLMDDDVAVSPESIKRTYNLLRIVKDEYADAFISGAMLNYEIGEDLWEDLGYMTEGGFCRPVKPNYRVSLMQDVVLNEAFEPHPDQKQIYAAWWYCCIPMATILKEGLPLPIFVRYDDVEYSLRCQPQFITMNGICIWHLSFHSRYSAAVERYQTTRNAFIAKNITGVMQDSDFLLEMRHNIQMELKKFSYENAELILDGFEDFLKGPEFIMEPVAEECFMKANRDAEKLLPLDELMPELEKLGIHEEDLTIENIQEDVPRSLVRAAVDFLSFNSQRFQLPRGKNEPDEKTVLVESLGWAYPAGKIHDADVIVAVDIYNRKAAIRHRDADRFKAIWKRYKKDVNDYTIVKRELAARYAAVRDEITSVPYWKRYLGITEPQD